MSERWVTPMIPQPESPVASIASSENGGVGAGKRTQAQVDDSGLQLLPLKRRCPAGSREG
ncbi:hypothetical protein [Arthrobacter sp. M4]|uniref:hypothetical protein n=1 Tax=Arthrobacter sp. M4 TaxID=218160 RepID=UPI0027DFCEEC|nr:hypothetical protein [Arthrobacter sp. M4]